MSNFLLCHESLKLTLQFNPFSYQYHSGHPIRTPNVLKKGSSHIGGCLGGECHQLDALIAMFNANQDKYVLIRRSCSELVLTSSWQ